MRVACLVLFLTAPLVAEEITVSSADELRAALTAIEAGDTLQIAPGEYPGGHHVAGRAKLTITALDPANPPVFVGGSNAWHFSRCPDLTVTHLRTRAAHAAHADARSPPSTRARASRGASRAPRPFADAPPVT